MRPAVRRAARLVRPATRATRALQRRPGLTVMGWHRVDADLGGLSTPLDVFRRQLDALEQWGAAVLPLDEAVRRCAAGDLPPRAVALTFDDGYASVIDAAWPLLHERCLPATLFVVSGYLAGDRRFPWDVQAATRHHTRLSTADEIRDAARQGLDIGSHTVEHQWLPHLHPADLEREMIESRTVLEAMLTRPVRSLAYPMGGWNATVRRAAADAGYSVGVTVERGVNSRRQDPLALKRAFAPNTVGDFELLLDGALTWLAPVESWRTRKAVRS